MQPYANRGGNSGIQSYELKPTSITVGFQDGSQYLYDYSTTGQDNVEQMKRLATSGQGLNEFINRQIGRSYARKLR
jgi:hypothetical protein